MATARMAPGHAPFEARKKIRTKYYLQFQPLSLLQISMLCDTLHPHSTASLFDEIFKLTGVKIVQWAERKT